MRSLIALLTLVFVCNHTGLYQWLLGDCCIGMDDCNPSMHCSSLNCPGCTKTPSSSMGLIADWTMLLAVLILSVPTNSRPALPRLIWRPPQILHRS